MNKIIYGKKFIGKIPTAATKPTKNKQTNKSFIICKVRTVPIKPKNKQTNKSQTDFCHEETTSLEQTDVARTEPINFALKGTCVTFISHVQY